MLLKPWLLSWFTCVTKTLVHKSVLNHCRIIKHLEGSLSECVADNVMQLSRLVTLSSRIQHCTPTPHSSCTHDSGYVNTFSSGQLHNDLTTLKTMLDRHKKESSAEVCEGEGEGGVMGGECVRWRRVDDMSGWVECPLGLCPGQEVSSGMFELEQLPCPVKEVASCSAGAGNLQGK